MSKKLKIGIAISIACIILVGTIIIFTMGLNFDLIYSKNKQITISIGKEFDIGDIRNIVKDATGQNKMILEKVELYEDIVSIKLEDITKEELETINSKINEKYEIENNVDNIEIVQNTNTRGTDIVKIYVYPVILSFILIGIFLLVYMLIKSKMGKNLNIFENLLKLILSIIIVQALYLSLIAILRIPINRLTMPISLTLYIITTVIFMCNLENKYKKLEEN